MAARVGRGARETLSSPPAVMLRLPGPSTNPMALGAATAGAQGTQ